VSPANPNILQSILTDIPYFKRAYAAILTSPFGQISNTPFGSHNFVRKQITSSVGTITSESFCQGGMKKNIFHLE